MRCRHERWLVLSVLIAAGAIPAGLAGWGADQGAAAADPAATGSPGAAVTEGERWPGGAIENAAQAGNGDAFSAVIDWDEILKRATAGIEVPEASRNWIHPGREKLDGAGARSGPADCRHRQGRREATSFSTPDQERAQVDPLPARDVRQQRRELPRLRARSPPRRQGPRGRRLRVPFR